MSIYTVNGNPLKYANKWLANGGTPSSELPPYDSSDAGKALVVNNEGDDIEWQNVGSSVTVDQHYDASSANPQSGTAVAEALQAVPGYDDLQFKLSTYEYPKNKSVTYTDDGKGVVCSYSLYGQGTSTAPSIDDTTIRDKMCLSDGTYDGVWFRLAAQAGAFNGYGYAFTISREMGAAGLRPILFKVSDPTVYYTFPNTVVPTWDGCATNPNGYQCGFVGKVMDAATHQEATGWKTVDQGMPYPDYSYWEILIHLTQSDMVDSNGNPAAVDLWRILQGFGGTYALGFYQPNTTGSYPNGCDGARWVDSFRLYASTYQIQPGLLQNKYAYLPKLSGRANQTISTKRNSSELEWVDLPQVDEQYSAWSLNAQSGFAVAEAISGVKQVPASTSADENKVLTVNSSGNAEWATPSGGTTYTQGNMISLANDQIAVSTTAGITDIQFVNALPANPVATVLYLIPAV